MVIRSLKNKIGAVLDHATKTSGYQNGPVVQTRTTKIGCTNGSAYRQTTQVTRTPGYTGVSPVRTQVRRTDPYRNTYPPRVYTTNQVHTAPVGGHRKYIAAPNRYSPAQTPVYPASPTHGAYINSPIYKNNMTTGYTYQHYANRPPHAPTVAEARYNYSPGAFPPTPTAKPKPMTISRSNSGSVEIIVTDGTLPKPEVEQVKNIKLYKKKHEETVTVDPELPTRPDDAGKQVNKLTDQGVKPSKRGGRDDAGYNKYESDEVCKEKWALERKAIEEKIRKIESQKVDDTLMMTGFVAPFASAMINEIPSDPEDEEGDVKVAHEIVAGKTLLNTEPKRDRKANVSEESF